MSKTAARDNSGKPMLSFILQFPTAVAAFARVKELGAVKYARDNWKIGGKPDYEYLDAALRHITSFMSGETFASDTGCTHLAHAMWNIMALQDLNYEGTIVDEALFNAMIEYWTLRRAAEAEGETFMSVEEFMQQRDVTAAIDAAVNDIPAEAALDLLKRSVEGAFVTDDEEESKVKLEHEGELIDIAKFIQTQSNPDHAHLFDDDKRVTVADEVFAINTEYDDFTAETLNIDGSEPGSVEPMFSGTFDPPVQCDKGDSIVVDFNGRTAKVVDEDGNTVRQSAFVPMDQPIDVDLEFTYEHDVDQMADELSAMMGTSKEESRSALDQVQNLFSAQLPLSDLELMFKHPGAVVTTLEEEVEAEPLTEEGLIGKTDKSLDELKAEASSAIQRHLTADVREQKELDRVFNHPAFRRYLREIRADGYREGYREGYQEGRNDQIVEDGDSLDVCDDPECQCNQ